MTSGNKFLSYALNLAQKNIGSTAPNPVVGCIITKNGEIISSGVTAPIGRPHAEQIAIDNAVKKFGSAEILEDATLYTTLEPCCHTGLTPPCTDAIIKHKFKKVVIAALDPDSRVNGGGVEKLREAAIDVVCDDSLKQQAQKINRGFFKARNEQMPFVTLKIATSLDGKIATKNFDSKWITSEAARKFAHQLRAQNDAILIGANTLRYDDPMLDCRLAGLEEFSPKRVVIAHNLDFDLNAKIFQTAKKIPTMIFVAEVDEERLEKLRKLDVEVVSELWHERFGRGQRPRPAQNQAQDEGKINLKKVLKHLCHIGINNLLVEGGSSISTQFLQENLVDELVWIRSGKIIGNDGIPAIGSLVGTDKISDALELQKVDFIDLMTDSVEIYKAR